MYHGHLNVLKFLVDSGVEICNPELLWWSIEKGYKEIFDFLQTCGANWTPEIINNYELLRKKYSNYCGKKCGKCFHMDHNTSMKRPSWYRLCENDHRAFAVFSGFWRSRFGSNE